MAHDGMHRDRLAEAKSVTEALLELGLDQQRQVLAGLREELKSRAARARHRATTTHRGAGPTNRAYHYAREGLSRAITALQDAETTEALLGLGRLG